MRHWRRTRPEAVKAAPERIAPIGSRVVSRKCAAWRSLHSHQSPQLKRPYLSTETSESGYSADTPPALDAKGDPLAPPDSAIVTQG